MLSLAVALSSVHATYQREVSTMASDDVEYVVDDCSRQHAAAFPSRHSATVADATSDSDRCLASLVAAAVAAVDWALEVEHFAVDRVAQQIRG